MAGKTFDLEPDAKDIRTILDKYVKPVMQKILLEHIKEDIYGAYSPKQYAWIGGTTYQRRNSLLNEGAIESEIDGNTIYVTSGATTMGLFSEGSWVGGPGSFLAMLEEGDMGAWTRVTGRRLPRPALTKAQKEVDKSQAIQSAVEKGFEDLFNSRNI